MTAAPVAREAAQVVENADLLRRVQVIGGFVEQVDRRRLHQQAGNGGAALLAARQRAEFALGEGFEAHIGERPGHALRIGGARGFPEAEMREPAEQRTFPQ